MCWRVGLELFSKYRNSSKAEKILYMVVVAAWQEPFSLQGTCYLFETICGCFVGAGNIKNQENGENGHVPGNDRDPSDLFLIIFYMFSRSSTKKQRMEILICPSLLKT